MSFDGLGIDRRAYVIRCTVFTRTNFSCHDCNFDDTYRLYRQYLFSMRCVECLVFICLTLAKIFSSYTSSSKLSVASVRGSIKDLLNAATTEKKRNFVETVELQIGLKNYDPQRDKRFSGTVKCVSVSRVRERASLTRQITRVRLPNIPRPRMTMCILADALDVDRAKQIELEFMTVEDLKK